MGKPNILFILMDDLGQRDLGCYGSTFYETPHLDRLAHEGMRFTDAYAACPVCSPTRASIMSGKYPATVGVTDWIDWGGRLHPSRGRVIEVPYLKQLPREETSLAAALREGGYATWHVGKWHLGGEGSEPQDHGFDVNIGGGHMGRPCNGYFSPWNLPNLENAEEGAYLPDHLTDKAVDLIRSHDPAAGPWFLNMWFYLVHTPIMGRQEFIDYFRHKADRLGLDKVDALVEGEFHPGEHKKNVRVVRRVLQSDPVYAAMVKSMDENIGRLLAAIRDAGQEEETLVVFTSDNGGLATSEGSPTSNLPLAEGKGWMYDGGTREPLIVKWPGRVRPESVSETPVTSPDFYPTLLDAAGLPARPEQHVDGENLLPLLTEAGGLDRDAIFWHYPHYGNQGGTPGASVRLGDWKLIRFFEDDHVELYNLREDVSERRNLAHVEPERRDRLLARLNDWIDSVNAKIPQPNPDYVPWQ